MQLGRRFISIHSRTNFRKNMKCQVCGEVFIHQFDLYSHFHEKHKMPSDAVLESLYSNTGNQWPTPGRNGFSKPSQNVVYRIKPNVGAMTGNGMLNGASDGLFKNYTHEEVRAILRFQKKLSNK